TAPLVRFRSDDIVRLSRETCACGRTHARVWPIGRKGDEIVVAGRSVLPVDVWGAVESVDACAMGSLQIVRTERESDVLRRRVGYAATFEARVASVRIDVADALQTTLGVDAEIEMVPNAALLKLGPPHKIPRVAPR